MDHKILKAQIGIIWHVILSTAYVEWSNSCGVVKIVQKGLVVKEIILEGPTRSEFDQ